MRQVRRSVRVQDGVEYPLLGMRWYGEGPFFRETVTADTAKARVYFQVRAGDFIYNRLFAWKGSFGVVPGSFDGFYVSGEFPVFEPLPSLALAEFVNLVMCRPLVWEQILRESTGSTATSRNRWNEGRFLEWEIPLPPLADQRRMVDLLHSVDDARQKLASAVASIKATRRTVLLSMLDCLDAPSEPVASLLSHVIGGAWGESPGLNEVDVAALGLRAFGDDDLTVTPRFSTTRSLSRERWADRALRRDDIILERSGGAEDKPVGRVLLADEDMESVVPTDFMRLLRVDHSRVLPRYVFWWLWARYQRGDTIAFQAKTTNIRNLRVGEYLRLPIPVPGRDEQARVVGVAEAFSRCYFAGKRHAESLGRTRSALLDDLLSGDHEIPASYDRFLDGAA
jgi:type I restriction enzyme S subunit